MPSKKSTDKKIAQKEVEQEVKDVVLARVKEVGMKKAAEEAGFAWQTVNKWRKEAPRLAASADKMTLQKTKRRKYPPRKKQPEEKKQEKDNVVVAEEKKTAIIIQSPMGGAITPEQILSKIPTGSDSVYVRVDENKLYWVKGDENGAVDIWD